MDERYIREDLPSINGHEEREADTWGPVDAEDAPFLVAPIGMELQPETNLPFRTAADVANAVPETVDWIVLGFAAFGVVVESDGKLKASRKTTFLGRLVRACSLVGNSSAGRPHKQKRYG